MEVIRNYNSIEKKIKKRFVKSEYSTLSFEEAFNLVDSLYLFGFITYIEHDKIVKYILSEMECKT